VKNTGYSGDFKKITFLYGLHKSHQLAGPELRKKD
jgi:hypothetical protein